MKYTILGAPLSPFVRKVRVFCAEKQSPYELDPINPFRPPADFHEMSPLKRIPVLCLRDDSGARRYLPDSSVICAFLDQMHPEQPLIPQAPFARGEALWFEEYADSELTAAIAQGIFQPVVLAQLGGRAPDNAKAKDTLENRLPPLFDYLEGQIGERDFLVENRFTIADIAVTSPFVNMKHAGLAPDARRWPRLTRYLDRHTKRASFSACIGEERAFLERSLKRA
jgi:glutathione S-transferase